MSNDGDDTRKVLVVLEADSPAGHQHLRRAMRDEVVATLSTASAPPVVIGSAPALMETAAQAERLLRGLFLRASYNAGNGTPRNPYVAPRRRPPKTLGVKRR